MSLLAPLLVAASLAQTPAKKPITGEVVDGSGKAVANARVVFYAPPVAYLKGDPVEVNATADGEGRFSLVIPPLQRSLINGIHFIAHAPGRAIGAKPIYRPPPRVVLQDPRPRTVKVEGPDGGPVSGARVALRIFYAFGGGPAEVPESLADALATSTGPDGTTTIGYLAARDQLAAVRVTADLIGSQDFLLVEQPGRGSEPPVITIKLRRTGTISGRLVDENARPVAGQAVGVWSKGGGNWLLPNLVGFKEGPLRTSAGGSFQTPSNLMQGSAYRVAVRARAQTPSFPTGSRSKTGPLPCPFWCNEGCAPSAGG